MDIKKSQEYLQYLEGFITPERKQKIQFILSQRTYWLTVVLEDVYQLHNTSAVMRSCDLFGIQEMHVVENKFGKRIDSQIAMGAQKWVDIKRHQSTKDCVELLKNNGYKIVATSPHATKTINDFDITQKTAFLFGTEKEGLSDESLALADEVLTIPMYGFTESFNISVACALMLYEMNTKLRKTNFDYLLTQQERFEKTIDWTKQSIKNIKSIEKRYFDN